MKDIVIWYFIIFVGSIVTFYTGVILRKIGEPLYYNEDVYGKSLVKKTEKNKYIIWIMKIIGAPFWYTSIIIMFPSFLIFFFGSAITIPMAILAAYYSI